MNAHIDIFSIFEASFHLCLISKFFGVLQAMALNKFLSEPNSLTAVDMAFQPYQAVLRYFLLAPVTKHMRHPLANRSIAAVEVQALPAAGHNVRWDAGMPRRHFVLFLAGLCEWRARLGHLQVSAWKNRLFSRFPGKKGFLQPKRAGLDTASIYIIATFVRRLPPIQALLGIVIGTISFDNWRSWLEIFGQDGPPHPLTALTMVQLHTAAHASNHARVHVQPSWTRKHLLLDHPQG